MNATLEIECPVCGETLALSADDRTGLEVGDAIACESCQAEMEITQNDGPDFELELLGILSLCSACGQEFDITEEMLSSAPSVVSDSGEEVSLLRCPHCKSAVEISFEDEEYTR